MATKLDLQVGNLYLGGAADWPAAQERTYPGQQLGECKRFDQIVVGAQLQPLDAVLNRIACGEKQHRRADSLVPQLAENSPAVPAPQHQRPGEGGLQTGDRKGRG